MRKIEENWGEQMNNEACVTCNALKYKSNQVQIIEVHFSNSSNGRNVQKMDAA